MVNTSVQEGEAPKQHTQHGGEGGAPHRAEAFVAMKSSEERCQAVTTHHAKHDNRAVASTTRYIQREGPAEHCLDQKAPEDKPRGRAEQGERSKERASQADPTQNKKRRAEQSNQGKTTARPPRPAEPATPKTKPKQKGKRHGPPKENQSRPKRALLTTLRCHYSFH